MRTRSLSPTEARVVLSLETEGKTEISLQELGRRARVSPGHARALAVRLVRKAWLQRTGRGRYLLNPVRHGPDATPDTDPLRLGSRLVAPYYFGYATAAELQGLLPQAGRVYYLVSPVRVSPPAVRTAEFRAVRVAERRFFGYRPLERRGERLVVSDLERTTLDCLARPEFAGGLGGVVAILRNAAGRLNWNRLRSYLARLEERSLELRLGYLLESSLVLARPPSAWADGLRATANDPYVPLGSPREFGRRGPHDRRWHVIVNVPPSRLAAEVEIR